MTQGIHTVFHFDENDKIDVVNQYGQGNNYGGHEKNKMVLK
jgi:hypothetical protein